MDFLQMLVPSKKIVLDRERTMHFNINTLANVEAALGGNALQIVSDLYDQFDALEKAARARAAGKKDPLKIPISITQLRGVLWAALAEDDPKLTVEAVGRMIHLGNIRQILEGLSVVVSAAFGPSEAAAADPHQEIVLEAVTQAQN